MSHPEQTSRGALAVAPASPAVLPFADPRRRRFLIISDGRAGSALMAAILAAAGLDFGGPPIAKRGEFDGARDDPGLVRADRILETAEQLTALAGRLPGLGILARLWRGGAKRRVRRLMSRAQCATCSPLAAGYVHEIGLMPQLIAVYRDFGDLARSRMLLDSTPWPSVADRALHIYRNALIGIHTFGGCAVSYEEIVDPPQTGWLQALADCTGLDYQALAEARARLVRPRPRPRGEPGAFHLDGRLDSVERDLRVLRGRYVPPSWQYLRAAAERIEPLCK